VVNGCDVKSQSGSARATLCGYRAPQPVRRHVVDERPPAVDLDHGEQLTVARLELRIAADVDLLQLEVELGLRPRDDLAGALAEVAACGVKEADVRYG
jgi:hypothetical protein